MVTGYYFNNNSAVTFIGKMGELPVGKYTFAIQINNLQIVMGLNLFREGRGFRPVLYLKIPEKV